MVELSKHYADVAHLIKYQEHMVFLFNNKHFVNLAHKAEVCQDAYDDRSELLERQDITRHYNPFASIGRVNPNNMWTQHLVDCGNYSDEERNQCYFGLIHLGIEHDAKVKWKMESSDDDASMSDNSVGDPNDPNDMWNRVIF